MGKHTFVFEGVVTRLRCESLEQGDVRYGFSWKRGSNEGRSTYSAASSHGEVRLSPAPIKFETHIESGKPKKLTLYFLEVRNGKNKELANFEINITKFLRDVEGSRGYPQGNEMDWVENFSMGGVRATATLDYIFYKKGEPAPTPNSVLMRERGGSRPPADAIRATTPPPVALVPPTSDNPEAARLRRELDEVQTSLMLQLSEVQGQLERERRGGPHPHAEGSTVGDANSTEVLQLRGQMKALEGHKAALFAELEAKDNELQNLRDELEATRVELANVKAAMSPPSQKKWAADFDGAELEVKDKGWDTEFTDIPTSTIPYTFGETSPPPTFQDTETQNIGASALPSALAFSSVGPRTAMPLPEDIWTSPPVELEWLAACSQQHPVLFEGDSVRLALIGADFTEPMSQPDCFALGEVTLQATIIGSQAVSEIACRIMQAPPLECAEAHPADRSILIQNNPAQNFPQTLEPGTSGEAVIALRLPGPSINRLRFDMRYNQDDVEYKHSVFLPVHLMHWALPNDEAPTSDVKFAELRQELYSLDERTLSTTMSVEHIEHVLKHYLHFFVTVLTKDADTQIILAYTTFGLHRAAAAFAVRASTGQVDLAVSGETEELATAVRYLIASFLVPVKATA